MRIRNDSLLSIEASELKRREGTDAEKTNFVKGRHAYLRLGGFSLGLLLNFEVAVLKDGIRRKVHTTEWISSAVATLEFPSDRFDPISSTIIGAAIEVHRQLGPGLLPKTYETCLCYELSTRRIAFQAGLQLPLIVDNESIDASARIPILVDLRIPVFPRCAPKILDIHIATATARVRPGGWPEALILNFHDQTRRQGIRRVLP